METNTQDNPDVRRANKNLKATVITRPKDLKEILFLMNEKIGNLSRDIDTIKKKQ